MVAELLRELNDVVLDNSLLPSPTRASLLGPDPFSIGVDPWVVAEKATDGIIGQIQPTLASEERRRKVIDYVHRLHKCQILCEVFPFGSVPLKTYLPDGDIDLTVFGGSGLEEHLANVVTSRLESQNHSSPLAHSPRNQHDWIGRGMQRIVMHLTPFRIYWLRTWKTNTN